MLHIGCHLSASAGYLAMAKETVRIGGDTFQFFTRNPRGGRAKDIDPDDVTAFFGVCRGTSFCHHSGTCPVYVESMRTKRGDVAVCQTNHGG